MEKISNWITTIQKTTEDFQSAFGECALEELNWKPNAQTWSVAQNIDHLMTINQTYFPVLKAVRAGEYELPFLARFGFVNRFWGNFILKSVSPDQLRKTKTLPIWEPVQSEIGLDILEKFTRHQDELIALIQSSKDLLEQQVVISSPANKYITYSLEMAFDIIVVHEKRHFKQAKETIALRDVEAP